jgi:GTP-binding protein EngB required for normal cell division
LNNICEIYRQLQRLRRDQHQHRPINFILSPINRFYSDFDLLNNVYIPINNEYTKYIETFILPLSFNINVFKKDLKDLKSSNLKEHLQQELNYAAQLFKEFQKFYSIQLEKFKNSVIQIRSGKMSQETLNHLIDAEEKKLLMEKKDGIIKCFNDLKSKNSLLVDLKKDKVDYVNISNTDVNQNDDQQTLEMKLIRNDRNIRIFCSNDYLRNTNNHQWEEFIEKLIEYRTNNNELRLIYADFSYSSYKLEELQILYSKKKNKKKLTTHFKVNLNKTHPKIESTINIVLFGESGVGKSTFINAFANYLLFENIDQARSDEPVVIIPVSFLMTVNDQFDERLIQFGRSHSNENHNNLGHSVTQQCKSYELSIRDGKILKIIDTPGFGDTRGQDQDEKNLKEIFSYIKNLTHLNALCILLKPNVKELNPSFKSSFRQILHFFGDHFYKNIFFCFTNSQSTFFTLGDTGPVLNQFLRSDQQKSINLKKENTFCFDSESFRYLVASQHSIEFDKQFIDQFEQSWLKSVKESHRLVNQIYLQEAQNNINQKWISIEQIKREINHLLRPILEAIRNIFRNIILSDNESFQRSIQLISIPMNPPGLICYRFDRPHKTFGEFHIMSDDFHESSDQCEHEHLITNYKLDYEYVDKKTDYSSEDANFYLYEIVKACANFDYFLNNNSKENKDGPFLSGINRMINEEKSICEREQSHHLNRKLHHRLEKLKDQYYKDLEINFTDEYSYLKSIYSRIEGIQQMPMIYEQLNHDQHQTAQKDEN